MRWRVALFGLTGVLTLLTAFGRFHDGRTGFLVWAPAATSLLSFATAALALRSRFDVSSRDRR